MKASLLFIVFLFYTVSIFSQSDKLIYNTDSVAVSSKVVFSKYSGQYGAEILNNKPIIEFVVTVKNNGSQPIPDLAVSNRSQYLNFYVNGKRNYSLSMYNGLEASGKHMLVKGQSDSYTWWIFLEDAYAESFTVKWEYCGKASKETLVDLKK